MAKKQEKLGCDKQYVLLAVVAIIAIAAIVIMVQYSSKSSSGGEVVNIVDDEGNIVGQAFNVKMLKTGLISNSDPSKKTKSKKEMVSESNPSPAP